MPEAEPKRPPGAPSARAVADAQRELIRAASSALDVLDEENAAAGEAAMERIRASGYSPAVIEHEAASLWASYRLRGAAMVIREVSDAARLADRIAAEHAAGARGTIIPGAHLRRAGRASAEAALAGTADAPLGPRTVPRAAPPSPPAGAPSAVRRPATTPAGEELRRLLPPVREQALSERLHGSAGRATSQAMEAIRRTIRESQSLDRAGKELITEVRRSGMGELGQGYRVPKQIEQLRQSAHNLAKLEHAPGSPAYLQAKRDWDRRMDRLTTSIYGRDRTSGPALSPQHGDLPDYLSGRGRGGMADHRGAYRELQQILQQRGPKGVERAFTRFTQEKQREHAERILRTEQAAAFRARNLRQYQASGYVLGVIWRLNHAGRRNYVSRTGVHRRGPLTGRHCICESMSGRLLSLEEAASYPRGGHPHCMCTFEPVYRRGGRGGEVTSEELAEMTEELGI